MRRIQSSVLQGLQCFQFSSSEIIDRHDPCDRALGAQRLTCLATASARRKCRLDVENAQLLAQCIPVWPQKLGGLDRIAPRRGKFSSNQFDLPQSPATEVTSKTIVQGSRVTAAGGGARLIGLEVIVAL